MSESFFCAKAMLSFSRKFSYNFIMLLISPNIGHFSPIILNLTALNDKINMKIKIGQSLRGGRC